MTLLLKKFANLFTQGERICVNAARVNDSFKKVSKTKPSQIAMIETLGLTKDNYIIIGKCGAIKGQIISDGLQFNPRTMMILIDIECLKQHEALTQYITNQPDIDEKDVKIETIPIVKSPIEEPIEQSPIIELPIIELAEHEQFRDVDGEIFPIEVRGDRSKDAIRFKAKDIERFFGINKLVKHMVRKDRNAQYKEGDAYVISQKAKQNFPLLVGNTKQHLAPTGPNLDQHSKRNDHDNISQNPQQHLVPTGDQISSSISTAPTYDNIFLTLHGLLQVVFTTKSGNANKQIVLDWVVGLVYTHQFGSAVERKELSRKIVQDFSKHMLNKEISGLYYVDIGALNDLYDPMEISREEYPPETYGEHHVAKFGRAEDIFKRVKDHKDSKTGYARWSKKIEHRWSIMISPSQLSSAEKQLGHMLGDNGFRFQITDPTDAKHKELILVDPHQEHKVKKIYRDILTLFPSRENELAKKISEMTDHMNAEISMIKLACARKVSKANEAMYEAQLATKEAQLATKDAQMEAKEAQLATKDESMARMNAEHRVEVLELQLEISHTQSHK